MYWLMLVSVPKDVGELFSCEAKNTNIGTTSAQ
jgi:hypothetical protein